VIRKESRPHVGWNSEWLERHDCAVPVNISESVSSAFVMKVDLQEREVWNAKGRKHGHGHPTDSFAIVRKSRHKGSRVTILETSPDPWP